MKVPVVLLAFPEGRRFLFRACRHDEDIIMCDLMDPPVLGTECEGVPHRCFPNKLLVELSDSGMRLLMTEMEISSVRYDSARKIKGLKGSSSSTHRLIEA